MSIHELLNAPIPEGHTVPNGDGSVSLRIDFAEEWLDELCNCNWHTRNFQWRIYTDHDGYQIMYGSIEVYMIIADGSEDGFGRTLTGAANFKIANLQPNTDYLATVRSLAVKNALLDLGRRGGRYLNSDSGHPDHREERPYFKANGKEKQVAGKQKPDATMRRLYDIAKNENNTEAIEKLENAYDFATT